MLPRFSVDSGVTLSSLRITNRFWTFREAALDKESPLCDANIFTATFSELFIFKTPSESPDAELCEDTNWKNPTKMMR